MTLNLTMPDGKTEMKPRITVFGVGGAGGNAVNNMIDQNLEGCEFVVANTDSQALSQSRAQSKLQIGARVTEGLGAGARPAVGASAAEESIEDIVDHLTGAHMAFITAGMGGGTGTGAAPIIAQAARELGVLTVGVVTKPFGFEGLNRMRQAEEGIEELQKVADTLIIIPNQNLFLLANERTTFAEAFSLADDVLYQGVKGVTDLMVRPGLINLDFADVRTVMNEMGKAMMGTGEGEGDERASQAAEKAIANPLLDKISLEGARGVLINVTGGYDLTLFELDEAANRIRQEVDPEANIIVGSTLDTAMEGRMRVSVVATGIDAEESRQAFADAQAEAAAHPAPAAVPDAMEPHAPDAPEEVAEMEPSFLEGFAPGADETGGARVGDAAAEVPPPAYRPAPVVPHPAHAMQAAGAEAGHAAMPPAPEAPSRPSRAAPARAQPADPGGKSRLGGINSLFKSITGHAEEGPVPFGRRRPPRVPAIHDDEPVDPDMEQRQEIPAFLRRQAN